MQFSQLLISSSNIEGRLWGKEKETYILKRDRDKWVRIYSIFTDAAICSSP